MLNRLRSGLGPALAIGLICGLAGCGDDEGGPGAPEVGTPAQLAFTVEPSDAEVNLAMPTPVGVRIEDESGNAVTTATNAVTLDIGTNPNVGTLTGTTTVGAVGGVASFTDLVIDKTGADYTLLATSSGLTGATSDAFDIVFPLATVSAGEGDSCGLTTGGNGYCWGDNASGQLGDGTTTGRPTPGLVVSGSLSFTLLIALSDHTCGVTTGGDTYCWGLNDQGQLGDGTTADRATPVLVSGDLSFTSLSSGENNTCGLTTGGDVYCWGRNDRGQLGDGTTAERLTPVLVSGGLSFASLNTGGGHGHTCGLTTGSETYCWGSNRDGQLGDGTTTNRLAPVPVSGGLSFTALSSGGFHSCGVTTGGEAYCWGANFDGQLGDGSTIDRLAPVLVSGSLSFASVTAGFDHSCGLTTGADAYCWGRNTDGQLGDGSTTDRLAPVPVTGGLSFASLNLGDFHSCALAATGGGAYCWGSNFLGQLGDGTTTDRTSPVRVSDP